MDISSFRISKPAQEPGYLAKASNLKFLASTVSFEKSEVKSTQRSFIHVAHDPYCTRNKARRGAEEGPWSAQPSTPWERIRVCAQSGELYFQDVTALSPTSFQIAASTSLAGHRPARRPSISSMLATSPQGQTSFTAAAMSSSDRFLQ